MASNRHSEQLSVGLCHGQGSALLAGPLSHYPQCHNGLAPSRRGHECLCRSMMPRGDSQSGKWECFLYLHPQLPANKTLSQTDYNIMLYWINVPIIVLWASFQDDAVKCTTLHLWAANLKPFLVAHSCMAFTACCRCLFMISRERPWKQVLRSSIKSDLKMSMAIRDGSSLIFSLKHVTATTPTVGTPSTR